MMEVIAFVVSLVAALFCGRWTLGPLKPASAHSKARAQFTIADILCLFVQIQLVLATIYRGAWKMGPRNAELLPAAVLLSVVTAGFWWGGVILLERAEVRNVWHRIFVLIAGIPVGVVGSVVLSGIPVLLLFNPIAGKWELLFLAPIVLVMLGLLLCGIRLALRRIVAMAQRPNEG